MTADIKEGSTNFGGTLAIIGELIRSQEEAKNKAEESINELLKDFNYQINIICQLGVGDQTFPLEEITHVQPNVHENRCEDEPNSSVACSKGQITVAYLWASWSGECQGPMKRYIELINKGYKVRFVALSTD